MAHGFATSPPGPPRSFLRLLESPPGINYSGRPPIRPTRLLTLPPSVSLWRPINRARIRVLARILPFNLRELVACRNKAFEGVDLKKKIEYIYIFVYINIPSILKIKIYLIHL